MRPELDAKEWIKIKTEFAPELCHRYCEAKNEATGRKAFGFGNFQLADGSISPYYFDLRTMYAYPRHLQKIVEMTIQCIEYNILGYRRKELKLSTSPIQRIAGIPNASLGLATLISIELGIPSFYCHMRSYYTDFKHSIQGSLKKDDHVLVLDDLTTTGMRKMEAINIIKKSGGHVNDVIVVIDREEGGEEKLKEQRITLHSLIKASEFVRIAYQNKLISEKDRNEVVKHIQKRREKKGLPPLEQILLV